MSAVSYFHKAHNLSDHTRAFLISKAIIGARNLSQSVDIRLPVTPSVLSKLVASTYHVFVSPYKYLMMRMIMVLAFQAYLRIGEIIPRSKSDVQGCLRLGDVVIIDDVLTVHFPHFKHSVKQGPQTLRVKRALIDGTSIDPFNILQECLTARGHVQAPLCSRPDGTPIVRHEFDAALRSLLIFSGLNTSQFKGHSFRIGSATAAAMRVRLTRRLEQLGVGLRMPLSDTFASRKASFVVGGHMDLGDLVALVSHLIQTICCGSLHLCRIATTVMSFCCTLHVYNIVYQVVVVHIYHYDYNPV